MQHWYQEIEIWKEEEKGKARRKANKDLLVVFMERPRRVMSEVIGTNWALNEMEEEEFYENWELQEEGTRGIGFYKRVGGKVGKWDKRSLYKLFFFFWIRIPHC